MTTVFIAGSISISRLHPKFQERIHKIVSSEFNVVVGDADGADKSIQECLKEYQADKVTIYCVGSAPRNNVFHWPVRNISSNAKAGSRAYFTAKDIAMARKSDYGLMIWDCKSTGTLSNVIELLKEKKKSVVFVNKVKDFVTVSDKNGLDYLLTFMSDHAREKAERKMGLATKVASIEQGQLSLGVSAAKKSFSAQDAGRHIIEPRKCAETEKETESFRLRSELISALKAHISRTQMSQSQAANVFGVTQPRISDLTRDKVELFGLDTLVNMASAVGLRVGIRIQDTKDHSSFDHSSSS